MSGSTVLSARAADTPTQSLRMSSYRMNPTVSSSSCACWRSIRSAAYPSSRSAGATRSQFPHSIDGATCSENANANGRGFWPPLKQISGKLFILSHGSVLSKSLPPISSTLPDCHFCNTTAIRRATVGARRPGKTLNPPPHDVLIYKSRNLPYDDCINHFLGGTRHERSNDVRKSNRNRPVPLRLDRSGDTGPVHRTLKDSLLQADHGESHPPSGRNHASVQLQNDGKMGISVPARWDRSSHARGTFRQRYHPGSSGHCHRADLLSEGQVPSAQCHPDPLSADPGRIHPGDCQRLRCTTIHPPQ